MTSDSNRQNGPEDLDGYEYFHPVHVLGFWLHDFIETVCQRRFLDPPPNGSELTREAEEAEYGPIVSTRDWLPWSERRQIALDSCDKAWEAAVGVNRWLRYGLCERAGKLETEFRSLLPELLGILRVAKDPERFKSNRRYFETHLGTLLELERELGQVAINPDDGALEEWFKYVEVMRSSLSSFLDCHRLLHRIVFSKPRGRIGDLLYRYLVSISNFEVLLPMVESQIRRGFRGDQEYERAVEVVRLSAQARWSFEEILENHKLAPGSYPIDIHELVRSEANRVQRKLELTLSGRPKADQPLAMWTFGIAYSPAQLPFWDKQRRELRFGDKVCKRFRTRATNQELVLQSFQELGWPPRIDDPLTPGKRYETIRQLNEKNEVIKFSSDGSGESICWALACPPK
ncbi:MAG: hypothetical protein AABZ47_18360 [Planctomycetota bacterium]